MDKFKIQDYSDGGIYKRYNQTYIVETSQGTGEGNTVIEALNDLAFKATKSFKKPVKKSKKNTIA